MAANEGPNVAHLRVDRLADGTDGTKRAEIVSLGMLRSQATKQTNGSRSRVELYANLSTLQRRPWQLATEMDAPE